MRRLLPRFGRTMAALFLLLALEPGSVCLASETIRIRPGFQQILERSGVSRISRMSLSNRKGISRTNPKSTTLAALRAPD